MEQPLGWQLHSANLGRLVVLGHVRGLAAVAGRTWGFFGWNCTVRGASGLRGEMEDDDCEFCV